MIDGTEAQTLVTHNDVAIPSRSFRKRRREEIEYNGRWSDLSSAEESLAVSASGRHIEKKVETELSHIRVPQLAYPKSLYIGNESPLPVSCEPEVLSEILVSSSASCRSMNTNDHLSSFRLQLPMMIMSLMFLLRLTLSNIQFTGRIVDVYSIITEAQWKAPIPTNL